MNQSKAVSRMMQQGHNNSSGKSASQQSLQINSSKQATAVPSIAKVLPPVT